jgi:rRNA maturation protein Nop10
MDIHDFIQNYASTHGITIQQVCDKFGFTPDRAEVNNSVENYRNWLGLIHDIAVDRDGCISATSLGRLIDDLRDMCALGLRGVNCDKQWLLPSDFGKMYCEWTRRDHTKELYDTTCGVTVEIYTDVRFCPDCGRQVLPHLPPKLAPKDSASKELILIGKGLNTILKLIRDNPDDGFGTLEQIDDVIEELLPYLE